MDADTADARPTGTVPKGPLQPREVPPPDIAVRRVRDLLEQELRIPDYQRPYAWGRPQVADLVNDIKTFTASGRYRLGTVILHKPETGHETGSPVRDVVDGQQRLTTLHLLIRVLQKLPPLPASPTQADKPFQRRPV